MSLFGALSASLTSLTAQSSAVNSISNNISNLNTTGFKATTVSFSTLVTGQIGGGVLQGSRNDIDEQGAIQSTGVGTDMAIQGSGFFTVQDVSGNLFYTRAGSFRTDSTGNLVNEAGYTLMGWPLDSEGRLPGEAGNTTFTTSNQDPGSLTTVSTASITGTASPTTSIDAKINLKAEEAVLQGGGDTISFTNSTYNSGISSTDIIVPSGANMARGTSFIITPGDGTTSTFTYGGFADSFDITATAIGGAANPSDTMTGFTDGDAFTITVGSNDAVTFTYQSSPDLDSNQFSNMNELAQIINATAGLTSRVGGDNVMYIASETIGQNITFADVSSSGLVAAFDFNDIVLNDPDPDNATSATTFSNLSQLAQLVNASNDFAATISSPSGNSSLRIYNTDSTDSITFSDSLAGDELTTELSVTTTAIPAVYDPGSTTLPLRSMASGNISPDFSRTITVYTSLGEGLDLRIAFTRLADESVAAGGQTWGVELFAADPDDVSVASRDDGLVAAGEIRFDGTGALLEKPISFDSISITPSGGASELTVSLDLGEIGTTDGISQFAGQYSVDELSQNGFPTGRLQALDIDAQGFVTAIFDNSLTSRVYKLPVAYFSNPNGLTPESGNAYSANNAAGEVTLGQVGDAAVGNIVPSALEVSTAEIGNELTNLIVAQQAYSASTNVLRKVTELFEELRNL
jgi:flagellar hook protein FlgE